MHSLYCWEYLALLSWLSPSYWTFMSQPSCFSVSACLAQPQVIPSTAVMLVSRPKMGVPES